MKDNLCLVTHAHTHGNLTFDKGGALCPLTGKWIKKIGHIHTNGISVSLRKEGDSDICDNMDKCGGHYAQ